MSNRRNIHQRTKETLTRLQVRRADRMPTDRPVAKGTAYKRIIAKYNDGKREYFLHATKGYRSYKA